MQNDVAHPAEASAITTDASAGSGMQFGATVGRLGAGWGPNQSGRLVQENPWPSGCHANPCVLFCSHDDDIGFTVTCATVCASARAGSEVRGMGIVTTLSAEFPSRLV